MSYSFSITASTKAEAKTKARLELAKAMANQPPHCHELPAVMRAVDAFVDALDDASCVGRQITVAVYGSVTCSNWQDPGTPLSSASVNINATLG